MIALFRLLARVPLPVMHAIGGWLGWLVWWFAPDYRRRFRENAEAAGFAPAQYRPAIAAAGAMVGELPWVWARPRDQSLLPLIVRWDGIEAFEATDVDEFWRLADGAFHQIDEVGAAGKERRARRRSRRDCLRHRAGAYEFEGVHATSFRVSASRRRPASCTAATMPA